MTNLIVNGEFTQGSDHWEETHPGQADFSNGECSIAPPGAVRQTIKHTQPGAEYRLAARLKAAENLTASVVLTQERARELLRLSLGNDSHWQVLTDWFIAPPGETTVTVTLKAEGITQESRSYFGSLELECLNERKPSILPKRIVAWWCSLFGA